MAAASDRVDERGEFNWRLVVSGNFAVDRREFRNTQHAPSDFAPDKFEAGGRSCLRGRGLGSFGQTDADSVVVLSGAEATKSQECKEREAPSAQV